MFFGAAVHGAIRYCTVRTVRFGAVHTVRYSSVSTISTVQYVTFNIVRYSEYGANRYGTINTVRCLQYDSIGPPGFNWCSWLRILVSYSAHRDLHRRTA